MDTTPSLASHHEVCTATPRPLGFAAIWFVLTIPLSLGATALQQVIGFPDGDVLELVMLAPAVAAGLTWLGWRGWLPGPQEPVPRIRMCVLLVAACGVAFVYYLVLAMLTGRSGSVRTSVACVPVLMVVVLQFVGAFAEEIGYRGVLLSGLNYRWRTSLAALIDGVVFGVIHVGYWSQGFGSMTVFVLSSVGLVTTMSLLFRGSFWQRITVVTVIHFGVNTVDWAFGGNVPLWQGAVAMWVAALALALVRVPLRSVADRRDVSPC